MYREIGDLSLEDMNFSYPLEEVKRVYEDIIDRLYNEDCEIDCEELDANFKRLGRYLNVDVPDKRLSVRLGSSFGEYVEDILYANLYQDEVSHAYNLADPSLAFEYLKKKSALKELLSEKTLKDFCFSKFYEEKCRGLSCAQKNA